MASFKSPDEIAEILFVGMDVSQKKFLLETTADPESMIIFHHSVGRNIRNEFDLWNPDNPYTNIGSESTDLLVIDDPMHPDEVSHKILMKLWTIINDENSKN